MREKEYSEWMSKQGFGVLLHANCCKIAFNGGWESRQTEVDELQKRVDAVNLVLEGLKNANYMHSGNKAYNSLLIEKLEQALKGGET